MAAAYTDRWRCSLRSWLERMRNTGLLRAERDPEAIALSILATVYGGLMLTQTTRSVAPLEAALDGALALLHAAAA